ASRSAIRATRSLLQRPVNTTSYPGLLRSRRAALKIGREQPEDAVAQVSEQPSRSAGRDRRPGMLAGRQNITCELATGLGVVNLNGDLKVQSQAARVEVRRADLCIAAIDHQQLRMREGRGLQ